MRHPFLTSCPTSSSVAGGRRRTGSGQRLPPAPHGFSLCLLLEGASLNTRTFFFSRQRPRSTTKSLLTKENTPSSLITSSWRTRPTPTPRLLRSAEPQLGAEGSCTFREVKLLFKPCAVTYPVTPLGRLPTLGYVQHSHPFAVIELAATTQLWVLLCLPS